MLEKDKSKVLHVSLSHTVPPRGFSLQPSCPLVARTVYNLYGKTPLVFYSM